jgi:predicted RNase H-like nuclease
MTRVVGVDGCRAGWMVARLEIESGRVGFEVLNQADELWKHEDPPDVVAIDIPIGLSDGAPRRCDREARRLLGARRSSVFPAPLRPALEARSRAEADRISRRVCGRGVSAQAFGLYGKVREIDSLLAQRPIARERTVEVHPEVSFLTWNRGVPLKASKKTEEGRRERLALAEAWLGPDLLVRARQGRTRTALADDDILDAIAVLWTAQRIVEGRAISLPAEPERDETGLRMQIVY